MTPIRVDFVKYTGKQLQDWLLTNVGDFKYTVGDTLYYAVGVGWELRINIPLTNSNVYWEIDIFDGEKAAAFKLSFL